VTGTWRRYALAFNPRGLSPEAHAMANALGSCLVDATHLQTELVALLRPHDQQQIADRSNSVEALVAGAAFTLCHQGKDRVFVKEIATEVNRLLKARGETLQFSPEKVGHKLRKLGVLTRRLSHAGNGLTLDQAIRAYIHEVAAASRGRIRSRKVKTSIAHYAHRINGLRRLCRMGKIL
jgi:hypothetical protein